MFPGSAHTQLHVFKATEKFVLACYGETKSFPSHEKSGMISQIRKAVLSVHVNLADGCSRKSVAERKRFYEIARGSMIDVDIALDVAVDLNYTSKQKLSELGSLMIRNFQMISKLILK